MDYPACIAIAKEIICEFETCSLTSYIFVDPITHVPEKQCTIGWGNAFPLSMHPFKISQETADEWLMDAIMSRYNSLSHGEITPSVWNKLTDFQKASVLSFRYNAKTNQWLSSNSRRLLNAGDLKGYAEQVDEWNNGGVAGLVRRRAVERHVFERNSLDEVKKLNWYNGLTPLVNRSIAQHKKGHLIWCGKVLTWAA